MFLYLRGNKLRENEASQKVCSLLPFSNELYSCFSTRGFPDPWRQLDAVAMGAGYGPALPCSSEASIRPGVYKSLQGLAEMLPCSLFPLCFYFGFAKRPPWGLERCSRRAQLRGWQQPGSRWAITATPRAGHTSPCHMGSSAFDSKMTEEGMRNTARARRWEGSDARRAAAGNRSVTSRAWGSKRQTWGPFGHPATTRVCSQPAGFSPKCHCPFWCRGRALSPRHRRAPRARCRRLRGILAEWLNLYFPTASHGFIFFAELFL